MAQKTRDGVRKAIFKSKKLKTITIDLFGERVDIRQPSLRDLFKMTKGKDVEEAIVTMLIDHAYVPGTKENLFDSTDRDLILSWPSGPWIENVNKAIDELINLKIPDAEKNSGKTLSAAE